MCSLSVYSLFFKQARDNDSMFDAYLSNFNTRYYYNYSVRRNDRLFCNKVADANATVGYTGSCIYIFINRGYLRHVRLAQRRCKVSVTASVCVALEVFFREYAFPALARPPVCFDISRVHESLVTPLV